MIGVATGGNSQSPQARPVSVIVLTTFAARQQATRRVFFCYCSFAYSALACFRMGMSGSASYCGRFMRRSSSA
jgi:hypothetical protein